MVVVTHFERLTKKKVPYALCLGMAFGWIAGTALADDVKLVRVPFVGCASDGQQGPGPAPADSGDSPLLPPQLASQLAFYQTPDLGVLAPRGWSCFGTSGSAGANIFVTPEPHTPNELFNRKLWIKGPAVQLSLSYSGTSGRFYVAGVAARLFPDKKPYVQSVIDEGLAPESEFKFGPYPHDHLKKLSKRDVEFETPAHKDGIGTDSFLKRSDLPIQGVAILLQGEDDLLQLFVRLPAELRSVTPAIIDEVRRNANVEK